MDEPSVYSNAPRVLADVSQPKPGLLLELFLLDVRTDIEVVARELDLRDEMHERLRRALDRLEYAVAALK
jgi:hypothetical protein